MTGNRGNAGQGKIWELQIPYRPRSDGRAELLSFPPSANYRSLIWKGWTPTQNILLGVIGIMVVFLLLSVLELYPPPERAMRQPVANGAGVPHAPFH